MYVCLSLTAGWLCGAPWQTGTQQVHSCEPHCPVSRRKWRRGSVWMRVSGGVGAGAGQSKEIVSNSIVKT